MYQNVIRPLLFSLPPEAVHQATLRLLRVAGKVSFARNMMGISYHTKKSSPLRLFGLDFHNRVGLAAGYDKDGEAVAGLAALGFGHIEVGTVTQRPQRGNPKPRLFRLPEDHAVINRMGFPGKGADYVAKRLKWLDKPECLVLGVNIGKNKDTPLENAYQDYVFLIEKFAPWADYLAINISSPNTVGLRLLQHKEFLGSLLEKAVEERARQADILGRKVPLLVKLAPDLTDEELKQMVDTIAESGIDGIIATNTTVQCEGLQSTNSTEEGGLSGQPLKNTATKIIKQIHQQTGGIIPIIGVGGVASPEDASDKIEAGASLVQIYTGLIYQGPGLVKQIVEKIG
jgi:dihydroorotate dehydrogenase